MKLFQYSIVVLAKEHNPSILNPDFLHLQEIVPKDWRNSVEFAPNHYTPILDRSVREWCDNISRTRKATDDRVERINRVCHNSLASRLDAVFTANKKDSL